MAYRKFDKEKYAQQQKQQMDEMHTRITEIGESFNLSPETIADYYSFAGRFYQYSPRNNMLIYDQNPHATFCGSYKYFQDQGYSVKKGQHGLKILVPVTTTLFKVADHEWKKVSEATREEKEKLKNKEYETRQVKNYKIGSVFDIAQTTIPPEEYPKFFSVGYQSEQHAAIFQGVKNYSENELNCPVNTVDLHSISLRGRFLPTENKIELSDLLDDSVKLEVALHEMGHAILHADTSINRSLPQIEFEADSIGLMFNARFGFDFTETQKYHLAQQYQEMKAANEKALNDNTEEKFDIHKILDNVSNTYFEHIEKLTDYVNVALLQEKVSTISKRFRDADGKLTSSIDDIAKQTQEEAENYYESGQKYMIEGEVKPFICTRGQENGNNYIQFDACYETKTGINHLHCVPDKMGTFLPGVASPNSAIVRMDELQGFNSEQTNSIQKYCSNIAARSSATLTKEALTL